MSVAGVAIATVASQIVSAVLTLGFLARQNNCCRLRFRQLRIYPDRLKAIIRIGLPAGLQSSLFAISNVLIQSSINSLGTAVMEANTAVGNLEGFLYIAMNAFYHSSLTFIGQNIGARQYHRIRRICLTCILLVMAVGITVGAFLLVFHEPLLSIYTSADDPSEMISLGFTRMIITSSTYFACGLMEVMTGSLRGLGSSLAPMLLSVFGVCGIRILWISTIFAANRTLQSLYIAYPVSWISTFLMLTAAFLVVYHQFMKKHAGENETV